MKKTIVVILTAMICIGLASCKKEDSIYNEYHLIDGRVITQTKTPPLSLNFSDADSKEDDETYDEGYYDGYEKGFDEGHDDGYDEGHDDGYDEGYDDGAFGAYQYIDDCLREYDIYIDEYIGFDPMFFK